MRVPRPPHLGDDQRLAVLAAALQGEAPRGAAAQLHLHQAPAVGRPRLGLGRALRPRAGLGALHGAGRGARRRRGRSAPRARPACAHALGEPRPADGEGGLGRSYRRRLRRPPANLRGNLGGKCRPGPGRELGAGCAARGGGRGGQGRGGRARGLGLLGELGAGRAQGSRGLPGGCPEAGRGGWRRALWDPRGLQGIERREALGAGAYARGSHPRGPEGGSGRGRARTRHPCGGPGRGVRARDCPTGHSEGGRGRGPARGPARTRT